MKLGLNVGYSGSTILLPLELVKLADRLGFDSVWTAEAYGSDAVTPLAWIGAQTQRIRLGTGIMQMPARTPAMTAMTAMTLDQLSGGRAMLGLGLSGPQVVEGWHGVPYGKPLQRTREYVEIVRRILAREHPLVFDGAEFQIPYLGDDATGLGKPLKSILHGRADLPIYLAAIGPRNIELAAEIADGWLPFLFAPQHYDHVFAAPIARGQASRNDSGGPFDIAPSVTVVLGDDVAVCRDAVKPLLALYIGGMGAPGKNFYFDLVTRYGYGEAAVEIQRLYLSGARGEAAAMVPDTLVDEVALCGPRERIAEGLVKWQNSPVSTLILNTSDSAVVQLMAELVLGSDVGRTERTWSIADNVNNKESVVSNLESTPDGDEALPVAQSAAVFAAMADRLRAKPDLVKKVGAIFQFIITGEPGGVWTVDLKNDKGSVYAGAPHNANVTITISDDHFVQFAKGILDPMSAFTSGKVKVKGNVMLATKLQPLFGM